MIYRILLAFCLMAIFHAPAKAVLVAADFNDLTAGAINGKAGGTGFTGNWQGSSTSQTLIAGDLSSSRYAITQGGTALLATGNNQTDPRHQYRVVTTPLTGEVWFSFLTNVSTNGVSNHGRAGLALNQANPGTPWATRGSLFFEMQATASGNVNLFYQAGGSATTVSNALSGAAGSDVLVVGKLTFASSGSNNDSLQLWLNPDLVASGGNINGYTPTLNISGVELGSSITHAAVSNWKDGSGTVINSYFDALRMSNTAVSGPNSGAFYEVTGLNPVPEPSAIALAGLAMLFGVGCFSRCCRRKSSQ